jgi:mRNA (guanine-N7-)-methyltransferase
MEREKSNYINMRKFHNNIKQQVIQKSVNEFKKRHPNKNINVLDISVGRFGDLYHYIRSDVEYVMGIDPDIDSINEAEKRLLKTNLNAELHIATITDENVKQIKNKTFGIVCCHFSLHYMFESEEKLRNMLKNVSSSLMNGGYFIGTTIDGEKIDKNRDEDDNYQITKLYTENEKQTHKFGLGYKFMLVDNPDSGIYFDLQKLKTEYLVNMNIFENIASEYGLVLINKTPFYQFKYFGKKHLNSWEKIISYMNLSFVFVKKK